MKNIGLAILIALLMMNFSGFSQAKLKFGHLNSNDLFALMPEKADAQKTLDANEQYKNEKSDYSTNRGNDGARPESAKADTTKVDSTKTK